MWRPGWLLGASLFELVIQKLQPDESALSRRKGSFASSSRCACKAVREASVCQRVVPGNSHTERGDGMKTVLMKSGPVNKDVYRPGSLPKSAFRRRMLGDKCRRLTATAWLCA
jgi:hypothetical protein